MLSDDEIIRRVRSIRLSSAFERNARRLPSINGLATAAGLTPQTIFRISNGSPLSKHSRERLQQALTYNSEGRFGREARSPQNGRNDPF